MSPLSAVSLRRPHALLLCLAAVVVVMLPTLVFGQPGVPFQDPAWSARTRVQITSASDASESDGYTVYSGVPIELSVRKDLGRFVSVEASAALESREVETVRAGVSPRLNLGSIEAMPLNIVALVRPWTGRRVQPYAGLGGHLTVFWEKSGVLDPMDLTPSAGLVLQAGADLVLSSTAVLNLDVKWNRLEPELESGGAPVARLAINPLTLGVGFGFRF